MSAESVYSRLGWSILPLHDVSAGVCSCAAGAACRTAGKHPRIKAWEEEATSDAEQLARWRAQWPAMNLGVAAGKSGFFVLDVDPKNGGRETLAALVAEHGPLPVTPQAITGSQGDHYYFQPVAGVTNSAGKIGPGLDVRGTGGQVVAPPSASSKGPYRWVHPPWSTPIASAPEWLLSLLRRSTAPARPSPSATAQVFFPEASDEVLADAAAALEAHGPAVAGEGGDHHTFVAAALLRHDFALSEEEAWPLLLDWNETCSPPWSEADLAAKMRGGAKYASGVYGKRRNTDAAQTIDAMIAEWNASGLRTDDGAADLVKRCRPLFVMIPDPARRQLAAEHLIAATGVSLRNLDLPDPAPKPVEVPKGSILVSCELHTTADEATAAIAPLVFSRNGVLCEVVKDPARTFISDLHANRVLDLISHARWLRPDDGGAVQTPPPPVIAQIVHSRRKHADVRVLEAVTTSPIFLADGEILSVRGYNAQARVFLEPSVVVDVPDEPTRDDAIRAVRMFWDLLSDFRFATKADKVAWLAGVLSPLVKAAIGNAPAPLICVSAAVAGSGKTKLTTIASLIVTGQPAEVRPYNPRDAGEWGKRVTAFVRAASPVSVFDNVNGHFGDETIDRLITSTTWSDRVLGASDAPPIPVVTTWWATGNNIAPEGDTVRRVLMVRLDVREERPQERGGFALPDIEKHTLEHRAELLTAALTLLRAYHVAGRPDQNLAAWGSFDAWSQLVRGALVWVGLQDPFLTQKRAAAELNEPDNEAHDFWLSVVDDCDGSPSAVVGAANARDAQAVLGVRDAITTHTLRKFIGRFVDKPRAGRRIRKVLLASGAVRFEIESL